MSFPAITARTQRLGFILLVLLALVMSLGLATMPSASAAGKHPTITLSKSSTRDCGNVGVKTPGVPYVQVERSLNPKSTTTGYWTKDLPSLGYIKVGQGCKARVESITGRYTITGNGKWQYSGKPTRGTVTITIT